MFTDKPRIDKIRKILRITYPHIKTQLHHRDPFELLVATILSAQCTDKQVNAVTPVLFKKLSTPRDFAEVHLNTLEKLIRSTGYFRNKAENIKNCSKTLMDKYNSEVPSTLEELVTLPGVGRKTANVVLGAAFGKPGMVVDTHVARISQRLDLTRNKDAVKIEFDLMNVIPKCAWNDFSLHLVYFGRQYCIARNPKCSACPIEKLCKWPGKVA
ncbi:MAG TPA: endonuclease III [Deltaproteobacteria bacterium]|nr:endonuclease III [Deltaproteobacteria bacterium]